MVVNLHRLTSSKRSLALPPLHSTKETGNDKSLVKKEERLFFGHVVYKCVFYSGYWNYFRDMDLSSTLRGPSRVFVKYLTVCSCFQIHFVSFNTKYPDIGESLSHSDGLAVLGVFLKVTDNHFLYILLLEPRAGLSE